MESASWEGTVPFPSWTLVYLIFELILWVLKHSVEYVQNSLVAFYHFCRLVPPSQVEVKAFIIFFNGQELYLS